MEDLIEIVNQLQDIYAASDCEPIDLPQIVVVGSQSCGKSSVLEHVVGKSFLPRGTGIVTRCPLILQMVHTPEGTSDYAIFNNNPEKEYTDYRLIKNQILSETEKLAGTAKGICNTPIRLKMFSPSFTSLTLIDLPGIVRVPVGDQPPNIEEQVRNLILSYIKKPSCLILAVSPANADLATSDSMKIASEVDPSGQRTLAVLTKIDEMGKGTDAWDVLREKIIPVKLGKIGVVNRSQQDIMDDKNITESREHEEKFFKTHYNSIAHLHGSGYLTKTVQDLLINHIKDCLPILKNKILNKLAQKRTELTKYEENKASDKSLLLDLLSNYSRTYVSLINGNLTNIETNELYGGSRISYIFRMFSNTVNSIEALAGLKESHMLTAVQNASGVTPNIFVPEQAFKLLVKKQIEKFREPSLTCLELVFTVMKLFVQNSFEDKTLQFERYSKLKEEIDTTMTTILQSRIPKSRSMLNDFIDVQLAHINTTHEEFFSMQQQSLFVTPGGDHQQPSGGLHVVLPSKKAVSKDKNGFDLALIDTLIQNYYAIEKKIIQDTIPKIIMYCIVNHVMERLERELNIHLGDRADNLLIESQSTIDKREALKKEVARLEKVQRILHSISSNV